MFENYFKASIRNLWKNKTYSFLNIFGLAIGIACAGLIFLWAEDELNQLFSGETRISKVSGVFAALLVALLTVSFQAIKAAVANPVKSLRTE